MPKTSRNSADAKLWLGVAKEKINPALGVPLRGYPTGRPNTGIGLDLYARAFVFGNGPGKPTASLTVLDSLHATKEVTAAIRRGIARRLPGLKPNAIMVAATHTHSAAAAHYFGDHSPKGPEVLPDPHYREVLVNGAVNATVAAWKNPRPVTVRHGITQAHLGHNRRVVENGYARNVWEDPDGTHTGYFNPDINVVRFDDAETGRIHAILAGYGCHPVTLGGGNMKASPDYPGYYVAMLEKATGAMAMHITTGAANINPRRGLRSTPHLTKVMAGELAKKILAILGRTKPVKLQAISTRVVPLKFRVRTTLTPALTRTYRPRVVADHLATEVQAIHFGDLALVSAPGELFAEIATAVREKSPIARTIVVEHGNDAINYIITDESTLQGGYEACRGSVSENMEQPYVAAALKALGRCATGVTASTKRR
jgi:hypothetical protein